MKRKTYIAFVWLLVGSFISPVSAATLAADGLVITQIQTGSLTSANEEFIELYNGSDENIDLSNWRLEYFSAAAANFDNPTRKIPLHGIIESHKYLLAASTGYLPDSANEWFSATLAKGGGHVRLVKQALAEDPIFVQDLVGWGTAAKPETKAAPAPADGKSLMRRLEVASAEDPAETDEVYIDTNNNWNDFLVLDTPAPRSDPVLTPVEELPPADPDQEPSIPDVLPELPEVPVLPDPVVAPAAQPYISELLPNPASPASDATDEFVELFNPNNESLNLAGYKLQTGNSYSYTYVFKDETMDGQSYKAFMVTQTGVSLSNAGGKARLLDPQGNVVSETIYAKAGDGQAWALINGKWQWTKSPTPGVANILTTVTKPAKKAAAKKSTKKATKAATKKAAKASKKKTSNGGFIDDEEPAGGVHSMILAVISAIAVGYAIYEYRDDIANRIHQLRRNRASGRVAGQER